MISTQKHQAWLLTLSVFTILFFNLYERYVPVSPELLYGTEFNFLSEKWSSSDKGISIPTKGTVSLYSDDYSTVTHITQLVPAMQQYRLLRLSADTKSSNIPRGHEHWMSARVILLSHTDDGIPVYNIPHNLVNLYGDHDWSHSSGVFKIVDGADKISVSVQLANVSGTFWVKNLRLQAVSEKESFNAIRSILIVLWLITILWIMTPLIRPAYTNMCFRITIALGSVITAGTLMPAHIRDDIEQVLHPSRIIQHASILHTSTTFQFFPIYLAPDIYKTGHFILFFLITSFALRCRFNKLPHLHILYNLILFALVTEILQLFIAGRNAGLHDLIVNFFSIILGLLLLLISQATLNRINNIQS